MAKTHLSRILVLLGAGLFSLLACVSPVQNPLPTYEVQKEKLKEAPPLPTDTVPGASASKLVPDPVQIDPKKSVGYENLPTTITAIYKGAPHELSISDVITETLANNRQLKIEGYTLRIAEYEVPVSKGIYDLLLSGFGKFTRTEQQTDTVQFGNFGLTSSRSREGNAALSQLLPTGATIDLAYDVVRTSTLIPGLNAALLPTSAKETTYVHQTTLGITQPLLRGFGPTVTNAGIRIAQLEQQGAAADFQTNVETQLLSAMQTYWRLIGSIEFFKVQVIAYSAARDLLRINEAKLKAGVVARTDVLQAEAAAESRRDQLIRARQAIRNQEDQLKRILFLQPGTPRWTAEIHPSQPIAWREMDVDLDQTIAVAMKERAEMRRATSTIDQTQVNLQVARNDALPAVNLFGQVQPNGFGRGFDEGFQNMEDAEFTNYNAGVEFSFPLQNRTARYRYKQADVRNQQAQESKLDLEDQITFEVRSVVRDLRTARERIAVTQTAVLSEEAKLDAELKRYDVGMSTAYQVIQFQGDLANAQSEHILAVIDYNTAAIQLERARGTLLQTYGVQVAGTDLNPPAKPVLFPVGLN